jgi:hypothetical protein
VRPRRVRFVSGLLLLLSLAVAAPLRAADDIELQAFNVGTRAGKYEFSGRAIVPADDEVRTALASGVTINLRLEALVEKRNKYWVDETVEKGRLQRELSWNALSQRYVLRYDSKEAEAGRQQTFATLEEALVAAGDVQNWAVVVEAELDPDASYRFSMRASLRRGRLASTLKDLTFWTRYWNHRSEWQSWTLRR